MAQMCRVIYKVILGADIHQDWNWGVPIKALGGLKEFRNCSQRYRREWKNMVKSIYFTGKSIQMALQLIQNR